VQLKFLSQEQRDSVTIKSASGEILAQHADMQHNKKYYSLGDNCKALLTTVLAAIEDAKPAEITA